MTAEPGPLLAALASGVFAACFASLLVPPTRRLAGRVRPYAVPARVSLGLPPDLDRPAVRGRGTVAQVFGPIVEGAAGRLGGLVDRRSPEVLALRLRQAGWYPGVGDEGRMSAYRLSQLRTAATWTAVGATLGVALDQGALRALVVTALAFVVGASRQRGRLDRAVEERRRRMRLELYTIDQLLAVRIRSGGGVVHAVQELARQTRGAVTEELEEALRLHRAGMAAATALRRIADQTPEPACARTYALLASSEERGADLAAGLLALAEDLRETRREEMRRAATRRRAAMLVPTIAVLAPVMLLFVAAPLPSLVLGWR
jgi:tight adherence protein C